MFHEMAGPLVFLKRGVSLLAGDEETVDVAGGGGGDVSPDDQSASAQESADAGPEVTEVGEEGVPEAAAPDAPEETAEAPAEEPADAPVSDAEAFEAALNDPNLGRPPGSKGSRQQVDYSGTFQSLREGDVVKGTVVHIDRDGVLVDVGTKSEGVIRMHELTRDSFQNPEDVVSVGEVISVFVMETESQDGALLLSKKRADFEVAWERVEEASKNGKVISAMVTDRVKGGLVVDLGIRGFVPASHVGTGKTQNLDRFIGQSIPLKVIEVDRDRRKVVLSHRQAVEEEREKKRAETLQGLAEGQQRTGIVRRITEYGAFVDLGGIDGLLHISEMSWTRINHPSEVVKVNDKIQVMVLKMNLENGRLSLGMRQILPDPWQGVGERYHVGDIIQGKISRLVPFGAFVQLEEGVEAIIPNQELSMRRIKRPDQVVSVGDEVEAKILDVRPDERRMTLSTRTLMHERDEPMPPMPPVHSGGGREAPRTTVADLLGEIEQHAGDPAIDVQQGQRLLHLVQAGRQVGGDEGVVPGVHLDGPPLAQQPLQHVGHVLDVDIVDHRLGKQSRISALAIKPPATGGYDMVSALWTYDGGPEVIVDAAWYQTSTFGFRASYLAMFEEGMLHFDSLRSPALHEHAVGGDMKEIRLEGDAYFREVEFLVNCLRDGRRPATIVSPESTRQSLQLVEAEWRSSETGQIITP